eukprot:TRINITY_DN1622_c0_g1_i1.p1 TRINITY_DN1622_c0_g1~~TRINITY_DN1622_c0_g1_i1.p1  ORF type:complete len:424 (-),score=42.40 TRINITY_DN1622_c0_g1_i1:501-1772(-)
MANRKKRLRRIGNYRLEHTIGRGNFAKVKYAINTETGQSYAIKILDKETVLQQHSEYQIKREIFALKRIRHPNIIRLYEVLANRKKVFLVLEYVNGGELLDKIIHQGKLEEDQVRRYFQQIIDAVRHCHEQGIYHRDLKLHNILVDQNNNIKVSDFGLSAMPEHCKADGLLHTTCGSLNYVAPEVLANRGYAGPPADVWSCGVILFALLTGCLPFDDTSLGILYQKIIRGDYACPEWISAGARNLITKILNPNPNTRISSTEIVEDEWFKEGYSSKMKTGVDLPFVISEETANAFHLIAMSSGLDLSGFFEEEDVAERTTRFLSMLSRNAMCQKIKETIEDLGFKALKREDKGEEMMFQKDGNGNTWIHMDILTLKPYLHVVEIRRGENAERKMEYKQLCDKLYSALCKTKAGIIEEASTSTL